MSTDDKRTILLVEDESIIAMSEKIELEKYGYRVHYVTTGEKAVSIITQEDFPIDLILMDIDLGSGIDGTEAAQQILRYKDIPVVFLSSHTEPEVVEKTEKITFYGYVVKNSRVDVLDASIKMALKLFNEKTKRMQAEKEQQIEKENLRVTLNSIGDAVISTDIQGRVARMNPVAEELTDWTLTEAKGKPLNEIFKIFNSETRERVANPAKKVLESGKIIGLANHTVLLSRNGKEYHIADSAAPIKNINGTITGVILTFSDVTEKYLTQKKLAESEDRLSKTMIAANDGMWDWNLKTNEVYFDPRYYEMAGYPKDAFAHDLEEFQKRIHPEDVDYVMNAAQKHLEGKINRFFVEFRFKKKNGDWLWIMARGTIVERDDQSNPIRFIGTHTDITKRKQAEEKLQESETRYRMLFKHSPLGIYIADTEGHILDGNQQLLDILGSPSLAATQQINLLSFPPLVKSGYADFFRDCVETRETQTLELPYTTKWGKKNYLAAYLIPLKNNNEDVYQVYTLMENITERKQAEEGIKNQLEEKETLLKEVHHRIKNNMANVEGLLSMQAAETSNMEAKAAILESLTSVQSIRILYDKMLLGKDYQDLSIKTYVEGLLDSISSVFVMEKDIATQIQISDFTIDSKKAISLGIIINELLTNVFKYAFTGRDNGTVTISIDKDENIATLIIQDNGIGIDERLILNKSSGLGLNLVKMLVEQLGGTFSIVNENGTKSTVKFKI